MRIRFFLPALLLLSLWWPGPDVRAQSRPLGPWRWTTQLVPEGSDDGWGFVNPANHKKVRRAVAVAAPWNTTPDSIRLFLRCENSLIAPLQPRKGQFPIRFSATGATVRVDAKRHRLLITPTTATVTLWAHKGQTLVFKHRFTAIPPPLPYVECWVPNRASSLHSGPGRHINLTLKAIPDTYFSTFLPDDARYRVAHYTVTLLRNGISFGAPINSYGPQYNLGEATDFLEGDRLQIDVRLESVDS
jgi:hypothetical protein